jgi:hypothetical protein
MLQPVLPRSSGRGRAERQLIGAPRGVRRRRQGCRHLRFLRVDYNLPRSRRICLCVGMPAGGPGMPTLLAQRGHEERWCEFGR